MKKTLLMSVAVFICVGTAAIAAVPALDLELQFVSSQGNVMQLASNGDDDRGSDDRGGDRDDSSSDDSDDRGDDNGGDRGRGRGSDDRSNDDNGRDRNRSNSSNDNSNDDNTVSGSNRRKPRVPGGSGCDDAGDIAEHAECRAQ
jgi:hypothetical protein